MLACRYSNVKKICSVRLTRYKTLLGLMLLAIIATLCSNKDVFMDYIPYLRKPLYTLELNGSTWRVLVDGPYPTKIKVFNQILMRVRDDVLENLNNSTWKNMSKATVIAAIQDGYLSKLGQLEDVHGVLLAWHPYPPQFEGHRTDTLLSTGAVMVRHIYPWTATEPLCTWVNTGQNIFGYNKVFGNTCVANLTASLVPVSLGAQWWQIRLPHRRSVVNPTYYTHYPENLNHLHIFQHAVVNGYGAVHSGTIKFSPVTCRDDLHPIAPGNWRTLNVHEEVFVIAQFWAKGHYHKTMEDFTRLAPYLDFLLKHKEIMVHSQITTGYTANFLSFLGIDKRRLLGGVVKTKIAYIPKGTPCGNNLVANTQYLAKVIQDKLKQKYPEDKRDVIILIKRNRKRGFTHHTEIAKILNKVASEHNLTFSELNDRHLPSMEMIMRLFHRAVMVVGPHGAGLSNILFSPPGTYVIEGVCQAPISNLCYMRAAVTLGHHYHAVPASKGCERVVNIHPTLIQNVVDFYIPHAVKLKGRPGNWAV